MSGDRLRADRDSALGDALDRIRALERTRVGKVYPANPVRPQLDVGFPADDSLHFGTFTVDDRVRLNAYLESTGAQDAYFQRKFTLGPEGSLWTAYVGYAAAPDGGKAKLSIASVPSPNPVRGGSNDVGTLQPDSSGGSDPWNWVELGTLDTYAAAFIDAATTFSASFRLMGGDEADLTAIAGTDPFVPCATGDGGAGQYAMRVEVNGKNVSSSGYVLRITEVTFMRLDDSGFA